tara:strand:- start:20424 stop:20858 length:435 start_codon:yes stop_codon:yes gene_type:complete
MKFYLAGPMSGLPQFNFPLFERATQYLREVHGLEVVSPHELDDPEIREMALASPDGSPIDQQGTWGDFLSRDVKIVADEVQGVILLHNWHMSRGARLEAFVGILCGHAFARYVPGVGIEALSAKLVLTQLVRFTHSELFNYEDL